MNKIVKYFITSVILFISMFINIKNVNAASASISISSSKTNVSINDIITVTVTISESGGQLGAWNFEIGHDSSKLSLISGSEGVYGEVGDGVITSKSYSLKYKAIANGSAVINVRSADVRDWSSESSLSVNKGSKTINIGNNQGTSSPSSKKSSDNNLKTLSIDNYSLSPEFNKDTLEYNVELTSDTTKIKVNAEASDSKARISGAGDIEVKEGQNKVEIVVTAENGSTKTYIINAVVKEKEPIEVEVDGSKYTVVRKKEEIEIPNSFIETTIKINDEDIVAYHNEKTGYTLVALKDEKGKIKLFLYDKEKSKFSKYNLIKSNELSIIILELPKDVAIPYKYQKTNFKYNGENITGYILKNNSNFRVVYAKDIVKGDEGFYQIDIEENTIQRFYDDQVDIYTNLIDKCKIVFIILGGTLVIFTIIIIILLSKNVKFKKKYLSYRFNEIDNYEVDHNDVKYHDLEETRILNDEGKNNKKTFLDE